MGTSFDLGWQQGAQEQQLNAARDQALKNAWRDKQATLLQDAMDNAPDPATRQQILQQYQNLYQPGDGPHLLRHLAQWAERRRQKSTDAAAQAPNAPQGPPPVAKDQLGVPYAQPAAPPTASAVGRPTPSAIAKAPNGLDLIAQYYKSPEQVAEEQAAQAQKRAEDIDTLNHKFRLEEIQTKPGNLNQRKYDVAAQALGYTGFDDPNLTQADAQKIEQEVGAAGRAQQKPTIEKDPATGHFLAITVGADGQIVATPVVDANGQPVGGFKPETVTRRSGFYYYTDDAGKLHQIPVTTETDTIFGPTADQNAKADKSLPKGTVPIPVSSKTPAGPGKSKLDHPSHAKMEAKKAAKLPQSSRTPDYGRVIGQKESPLEKADIAQYTKAAEDFNAKQEAYNSAKDALRHPTASSDQELIFSWVRSNVQGAGRMTQAEYRQAAAVGSLPLRAQTAYNKALTGRLSPQLEQMLFADIERAYKTSKQETDDLRARVGQDSGNAPPVSVNTPQGTGQTKGFDWSSLPR